MTIAKRASRAGRGCRLIDPALVNRMSSMVTVRTDEALNATLGISYHTWRKILAGQPIRESLASRLECRLARTAPDGVR